MSRIPVVAGSPVVVSASAADKKTIVSQSGTISYTNTDGSGTLSSSPVTVANDTTLSVASGRGYAFVADVFGVPDSVSEASLPSSVAKKSQYDIRDYHAAPDVDYGPAIYDAAMAAHAAGGGTIVIPGETYSVDTPVGDAPLTGDGIKRAMIYLQGLENVVIEGRGPASVITTTVEKTSVIEFRDCVGCGVRNLGVVGTDTWYEPGTGATPKSEVAGSCVRFTTCERCFAKDCDISHGAFGVYLTAGTTSTSVDGNTIHDCDLNSIANGVNEDDYMPEHGGASAPCSSNHIVNNTFIDVDGSGSIVLDNGTQPSYTVVSGNVIRGNAGGQGIRLLNAVAITCTDNIIEDTYQEGIYYAQAWSDPDSKHSSVIANNVLLNCGNKTVGVDHSGIKIANGTANAVDAILVHGNSVRQSGLHGIEAFEPRGLAIMDNTVSDNDGHGIYCYATTQTCKHLKIQGNTSRYNDLDGIRIESTASAGIITEFVVQHNTISDCGRAGLRLVQTLAARLVACEISANLIASCSTSAATTYSGMVIDCTRCLLAMNLVEDNGAVEMLYGIEFGTNVADIQWLFNRTTNCLPNGGGVNGTSGSGVKVISGTGTGIGIGVNTFPNYNLDISGEVRLQITHALRFGGTGAADHDVSLHRPGANRLQLSNDDALEIGASTATGGSFIQFFEQSADPDAPSANGARLFAKDNGSGKTQLAVRFPSGATQVIATEP